MGAQWEVRGAHCLQRKVRAAKNSRSKPPYSLTLGENYRDLSPLVTYDGGERKD